MTENTVIETILTMTTDELLVLRDEASRRCDAYAKYAISYETIGSTTGTAYLCAAQAMSSLVTAMTMLSAAVVDSEVQLDLYSDQEK